MKQDRYVIRCGKMLRVDGSYENDTLILIEDGKILSAGERFDIPEGAQVIDASHAWATPGLIESHGHLDEEGSNEITNDPIVPHMSAIDCINPLSPDIKTIRASGVTTMCSMPGSANLVGGTGIAVKLKDAVSLDEMLLFECQPLKMALGENPKAVLGSKGVMPASYMGNASVIRKASYEVRDKLDRNERLSWKESILASALDKKRLVKIHCHAVIDMQMAIRLAEEFHFDYTLEHATAGHLIADYLAAKGARCCVGPTFLPLLKEEVEALKPANPGIMAAAGVQISLIQDASWETIYLRSLAGVCVAHGLKREAAMRALTIDAAKNIGLEHRIGSIAKGLDADLAVFDGDPLLNTTRCLLTFIDGVPYYVEDKKVQP